MYSRSTMDTKFYYFLKSIIKLHRRVLKILVAFFPIFLWLLLLFQAFHSHNVLTTQTQCNKIVKNRNRIIREE